MRSAGGELNINVYPDIVGVDAVIPSSGVRSVVAAMTAAYFAPAIGDAAVKTAQRDAAVLAVQQRYSTDLTLHDLLFEQIFSAGPAHYPALPDSVSDIARISPQSIADFAKRAFRSGNALLAMTGNVDASTIGVVTDGNGGTMDAPFDSTLSGTTGGTTASGEVQGTGLAWVGPPIADEKAATALDFVADYLFRDNTGVVTRQLDARNKDAYVIGQFITLHDPGVMRVTIGGSGRQGSRPDRHERAPKNGDPAGSQDVRGGARSLSLPHCRRHQTPHDLRHFRMVCLRGPPQYAPGESRRRLHARRAGARSAVRRSEIVRKYLDRARYGVDLITVRAEREPPS